MRYLITSLCLIALAGSSLSAAEGDHAADIGARLKAKHPDIFAKADTNGDGTLSADELKAFRTERRAQAKAKADTNGDGKVDEAERVAAAKAIGERMQTKHPELFAKVDANHDGVLTPDELKAARKQRHGKKHTSEGNS